MLYFKDKIFSDKPILKGLMFAIRSILVAALAFLLLGPVWKGFITKTDKPIVVYLEDISSSINTFTATEDLSNFKIKRDQFIEQLGDKFEVEEYVFGADLMPRKDSLLGMEKATNISQALEKMLESHSHQNIGAIVLATDGIYNQGYNPAYSKINSTTSIYTIALGDSTPSKDLFVQALQYPKVVYMGDKFQLDIEFGAYNLAGNSATLKVTNESKKVLLNKVVSINSDEVFERESVIIDAVNSGVQKYKVELSTNAKEDIASNNYQSAYVEVLDGRKNVLLLYAGAHPDIKALKAVIEENKNYEVTVNSIDRFSETIDAYDLIILHGLPSVKGDEKAKNIFRKIKEKGKSVAVVITESTDLNFLNAQQSVLKIKASGQKPNEVQGLLNSDFNDFQIPDGLTQALRNYPPLLCPFGEYEEGPNTKTIIFQRLDDINTGYPMVLVGQEGSSRIMFINGEGIWRWRMAEFAQNESTTNFDQLFNQLIQYVAIKEDKRKFRLLTNKSLIWENEPVLLNAELYNANYELINEPDVTLEVKDGEGKTYDFVFDKTLNAYSLDAGLLPVGNYTALARTSWSNENYNAAVKFTIREVQLETLNKQANHNMLYNLSNNTGGKMYTVNNMELVNAAIQENVNLKPVLYNTVKTTSLLHYKWIFFILLGLLSIEWVVRKWTGGY